MTALMVLKLLAAGGFATSALKTFFGNGSYMRGLAYMLASMAVAFCVFAFSDHYCLDGQPVRFAELRIVAVSIILQGVGWFLWCLDRR